MIDDREYRELQEEGERQTRRGGGQGDKGRKFEMLPTSAILGWSHYRALLEVGDSAARAFCLEETVQGDWSVRRLESQIQARVFAQHAVFAL